jgi:hypothetical protein
MGTSRDTTPDPEVQRETLRLWVARGKVIGGLVGFLVATMVARRAGLDWVDAGLRGLVGAAALALVGWLCALLVMNALMRTVVIHARDQERRRIEEMAAARDRADAGDAAPEASGLTDRTAP